MFNLSRPNHIFRKITLTGFYYPLYLILGFYLVQFFQYQIDADGTALLGLAKAIRNADLDDSINAYWGIWSSLIIAPFLFFNKFQPLFIVKISSVLLGFLGLGGFYKLVGLFNLSTPIKILTKLSAIPLYLYFALSLISSDFLIVILLTFYFSIIFSKSYGKKFYHGLLCGVLGGLLLMTKEYFFYYFLAHFMLLSIIHFFRSKSSKKVILRSSLVGLLIFILIALGWGLTLQSKYHYFMFGSRGSFNTKFFNPKTADYPMFTEGLIKPPNQYGFSAWDDPTLFKLTTWSPLASKAYFLFQINTLKINIQKLLEFYYNFSFAALLLLLIVAAAYLLINFKKILSNERILFFSLITVLTYPVGYLIISIEERYLWPNYILLLLIAAYLGNKLIEISYLSVIIRIIIAGSLIATFVKTPFSYLKNYHYVDHTFYDQSKILAAYGIQNVKIASNNNWHQSLYISVFNNNKYFGISKLNESYKRTVNELKRNSLDYYFIWGEDGNLSAFQQDFTEIYDPQILDLHVFSLKHKSY